MELTQTKIESATELVGQYEVGFMWVAVKWNLLFTLIFPYSVYVTGKYIVCCHKDENTKPLRCYAVMSAVQCLVV